MTANMSFNSTVQALAVLTCRLSGRKEPPACLSSTSWLRSKPSGGPAGGGGSFPPLVLPAVRGSELIPRALFHTNPPFLAVALSGSQFGSSPVGEPRASCRDYTPHHSPRSPLDEAQGFGAKDVWTAAQADHSCQAATKLWMDWSKRVQLYRS